MLQERGVGNTRLWPRGVDLDVFNPAKRSTRIRQSYGVVHPETMIEMNSKSQRIPLGVSSPASMPVYGEVSASDDSVVILSVGRMYVSSIFTSAILIFVDSSYEKNLVLLVHAFALLIGRLPPEKPKPRLVFVGKPLLLNTLDAGY
jgi:glycosyltransferase involved in cell wall biosynthesis